jgi:hypothetical protein
MRWFKFALVRALLLKTIVKTFARQLYLKLTKITRRSSGPKSFLGKFSAGYEFLRDMSEYNWGVIKRCRRCMKSLSSEGVPVLVYGEKDIIDVLHDLSFETPVKMRILRERYEADKKFGRETVAVEMGAASREKILVASLINTEERIRRLRELGVDNERIVLLS